MVACWLRSVAYPMAEFDDQVMRAVRARARRTIQAIFAGLALCALAFAVLVHHTPGFAGLAPAESNAMANAFLFLGTANTLTMWVWDYLFWNDARY